MCAIVSLCVEELQVSEQEKSSQAAKIQTLEGIRLVLHNNIHPGNGLHSHKAGK